MIDEDERPEGEETPPTSEGSAPEQDEAAQPSSEAAADAPADDAPADEAPAADAPADDAPAAAGDDTTPSESAAEGEGGGAAAVEASAPDSEQAAAGEAEQRPAGGRAPGEQREEAIPGAHLEPDLVLEETAPAEGDPFAQYREGEETATAPAAEGEAAPEGEDAAPAPAPRTTVSLAADARYQATGKRKTSVARVILKPGDGTYTINGRPLAEFFPRPALQVMARQALDTAGYQGRMDVVARIHGGGVASQAGALRHGVARALVEADPNLRTDLKRQGFLTRDARVKERRKAGLKKARKKPQFSKR